MSLFAIGDLHLSLTTDKPMDIFGETWQNHMDQIEKSFSTLDEDDLIVLAGDSSWGISLAESLEDFQFIDRLPGKKLLLKGNHDYWWETISKTKKFFQIHDIHSIDILHNNAFLYEKRAICGTRGWFAPEEGEDSHAEKIYRREIGRLQMSLEEGRKLPAEELVCFLHYPPISKGYECEEITDMLQFYHVSVCCYGHLHGPGHGIAIEGLHKSVRYQLISADYLKFMPIKV